MSRSGSRGEVSDVKRELLLAGIKQNALIHGFVDSYMTLDKSERERVPYSLKSNTDHAQYIVDGDGYVVAEIDLIDGAYEVVWCQSAGTLTDLDLWYDIMQQGFAPLDSVDSLYIGTEPEGET